MDTYIALFRGINVGGRNVLPMKALMALFEAQGAREIRTHVQSGNVVFRYADGNPSSLIRHLADEINRHFGFIPRIFLLSPADLERAMAGNPFPEAETDPGCLHLGFLAAVPTCPDLVALDRLRQGRERFHLGDGVFYLYAPDGIGRSTLAANSEKLLGVPMTDRNWKTVCKLRELVAA